MMDWTEMAVFGSHRDSGLQIDGILVDKNLVYRLVGHYCLWTIREIRKSQQHETSAYGFPNTTVMYHFNVNRSNADTNRKYCDDLTNNETRVTKP